jgi:hypothetical protein
LVPGCQDAGTDPQQCADDLSHESCPACLLPLSANGTEIASSAEAFVPESCASLLPNAAFGNLVVGDAACPTASNNATDSGADAEPADAAVDAIPGDTAFEADSIDAGDAAADVAPADAREN